ncbi:hypothetical protein HKX48_000884, partial [Thoreauomyces humboldtii]
MLPDDLQTVGPPPEGVYAPLFSPRQSGCRRSSAGRISEWDNEGSSSLGGTPSECAEARRREEDHEDVDVDVPDADAYEELIRRVEEVLESSRVEVRTSDKVGEDAAEESLLAKVNEILQTSSSPATADPIHHEDELRETDENAPPWGDDDPFADT